MQYPTPRLLTLLRCPKTVITETELGDGLFIMMYIMRDILGNVADSVAVTFESAGG